MVFYLSTQLLYTDLLGFYFVFILTIFLSYLHLVWWKMMLRNWSGFIGICVFWKMLHVRTFHTEVTVALCDTSWIEAKNIIFTVNWFDMSTGWRSRFCRYKAIENVNGINRGNDFRPFQRKENRNSCKYNSSNTIEYQRP